MMVAFNLTKPHFGVHMKRQKNALVVIVENSQMAVTSTKFWNIFNFKKVEVQKLENFEKLLLHLFVLELQDQIAPIKKC